MKSILTIFLLLTFAGPLWLILSGSIDFSADYRTANRESSHQAPQPKTHPEAIIQVYTARAFNWRGIFSLHVWLAVKPKDADQYTVYQVVGWHLFQGYSALYVAKDIPDRYWFDQKPKIILDIRGKQAQDIIPKINEYVKKFPYANEYVTWPGPNSNTFMAYLGRNIPELNLVLPSNALGKDYLGRQFFARAPSDTGYQFSIYGLFGILLAKKEGFEINILGLVYGVGPHGIKLPGFGDIDIFN